MDGLLIVQCNLGGDYMESKYLLSEEIIFDAKPIAVPYNYRISYKISQLLLILSLCSPRGGCSLVKLHMIAMALSTDASMRNLELYVERDDLEIPVVRFDPAVNRALVYAITDNVIIQQKDGKLKLSPIGKLYVERIMKQQDLMCREKIFLKKISNKITEAAIKDIMTNWRYQNATN